MQDGQVILPLACLMPLQWYPEPDIAMSQDTWLGRQSSDLIPDSIHAFVWVPLRSTAKDATVSFECKVFTALC